MYIAPYIDYIPAVPSIAVSVTAMGNSTGHLTEDPSTMTQISISFIVLSFTGKYVFSKPTKEPKSYAVSIIGTPKRKLMELATKVIKDSIEFYIGLVHLSLMARNLQL